MTAPAPTSGRAQAAVQPASGRAGLWLDIWHLLQEFWAAHPIATIGMAALNLLGGARAGLYVYTTGAAIDALVGVATGGTAGEHSVVFWVLAYIGAHATEGIYWGLQPVLWAYLMDHAALRIQRRVLERAAAAPLIQFEQGAFFDHLQRAAEGMGERLVQLSGQLFSWLAHDLVRIGSVSAALLLIHPALLPLLAVGILPSLWLQARVATVMYEARRAHTTRERIRGHLQHLLTGREAAAEVRLFGTAPYLLDRWLRLRREWQRDLVAAQRRRSAAAASGSLIAGLSYSAALVLVTALILQGQLSIGDYVAVASGASIFQEILSNVLGGVRGVEEQSRFLGDLFAFSRFAEVEGDDTARAPRGQARGDARRAATIGARKAPGRGPTEASTSTGVRDPHGRHALAVAAEGVTFRYPGGSRPVLRNISLRIEPGERIAVVGENGAGKTTLAKLLIGLYEPDQGVVYLNGEPLTRGRAVAVRRQMAAVFQDFARYELTARENIGFGNLQRAWDDRALASAAERAGIAGLIAQLPEGYDAYLGRQFGHTELSGGQWQRVALARAFFRDAALLVLDEPTASLDPLAELALFERFVELVEGRTAIMISHRLGAARLADRVVVLRDGEIVEEGDHQRLVAQGGEYARLCAAQAQWYRR